MIKIAYLSGEKVAMQEVSAVAVVHEGKLLMGKRRDNGKHTNPGGHVEPGEHHHDAAKRELMEEAGIDLPKSKFKHQSTSIVTAGKGKKLKIHSYRVDLKEKLKTTMKHDPDQEVHGWKWVKHNNKKILSNMHVPPENNCIMHDLMRKGMEKKARTLPGGAMTLVERLNLQRAAKEGKKVVEKVKKTRPTITEPPTLDYSTFNGKPSWAK